MKPSTAIRFPGAVIRIALVVLALSAPCVRADSSVGGRVLSLAGEWRARLDRADEGLQAEWQAGALQDAKVLQLPGTFQGQGLGDAITTKTPWVLSLYDRNYHLRLDYRAYTSPGSVKVPFICQPVAHYLGAAWVERTVTVPADWAGARAWLRLERPRWETQVWIDGRSLGKALSLVAPHDYEAGPLMPGAHRITVRIDNRMLLPYRPDAHAVSDSLGGSWSGIVGAIELRATPRVWIDTVQLHPDAAHKKVTVKGGIGNHSGKSGNGRVRIEVRPEGVGGGEVVRVDRQADWSEAGGSWSCEVPLGAGARLWDEYEPALYRVEATLETEAGSHVWNGRFGLRDFKADGRDFSINGRRIHLRGTHHGGDFPLTGHPPTDVGYWRRLFEVCKKWGLNHVRFHSFCPPEAAFDAADELGVYLQPEAGMWNEISPGTAMEKMLYEESDRMLRAYGNHPSFVLFSPSNEPKGRWKEALPRWVRHYGTKDARRLYTTGTGWSLIDEPGPVSGADFLAVHRIGLNMLRGKTAWFGKDYVRSLRGVDVPVVSHELGQWCAYPDFSVIAKFTGYLRPGNYEIFRDSAAARGVLSRNREFAQASGRYQLACYKEDIEANLRTPGLGGFQLLDLHDYVGQGTALVGVLDPFWEEKGYVTAEQWRRFCSETVPLARLTRRVFQSDETLDCEVEVAHWGRAALAGAQGYWRVCDADGREAARGDFERRDLPLGSGFPLGRVTLALSGLRAPGAYRLVVGLAGTTAENDWSFWVYPKTDTPDAQGGATVVRSLTSALELLGRGGRVVYVPRSADLGWSSPPLDGEPIFWNRLMSPGWGRMLGLWCEAGHPAFGLFPTEAHCDWQWCELTRGTRALNLAGLPEALRPQVQAIDDWNRNWRLGLVFEARVGKGRLLVCAFDIERDLEARPVARQLRRSLLAYAGSAAFDPQISLSEEQVRNLGFDTRLMAKLGVRAEAAGQGAQAAVDGDPNTFWSVGGGGRGIAPVPHPHVLTLHFDREVAARGLVLMNRQNDRDHLGDIREYRIEASVDGAAWREVTRGSLESTWEPQTVPFGQLERMRHLRFTALSGFGADTSVALAEIALLYEGPALAENDDAPVGLRRVRSTSTDVEESPPEARKPLRTGDDKKAPRKTGAP